MEETFFNISGKPVYKPANVIPLKRLSVYALIIKNNQLLLVHPTYNNKWEIPGGGVNKDETELLALQREVLEETGYQITKINQCIVSRKGNFYADDIDKYYYSTQKFYTIKDFNKIATETDRKEISQIKWFDLKEATKFIRENEIEVINNLLNK